MSIEMKLSSETIEPYMAQCIGIWFDTLKNTPNKSIEDYKAFWYKVEAFNTLTVVTDSPHASIAIMNHLRDIARFIKEETGQDVNKWSR